MAMLFGGWPVDAIRTFHGRKVGIRYCEGSDKDGTCMFYLHRWDKYFPGHPGGAPRRRVRGQVYRCDPRSRGFPRPEELGLFNGKRGRLE